MGMNERGWRQQTALVALANADYETSKVEARKAGHGHGVTVRMIERRWKVKAGQILNFRANLPRKKTLVPDNWP
jgi:hypothetical protein